MTNDGAKAYAPDAKAFSRDLHSIKVETDAGGLVTGVLIDGQRVRGLTGISASTTGPFSFLNVTLSIEAASVEGLVPHVFIERAP